jgi:hypothetical protein
MDAMSTAATADRPGLFAFDVGAALVALVILGAVAFVLSFNQL